jgi:small subunit ribosomal protein S16
VKEKAERNNPKKGTPGDKAKARAVEKADKATAAAEAAAAPAAEPEVVEEAPAEEAKAD